MGRSRTPPPAAGVDSIDSIAYYTSRAPWVRAGHTHKATQVRNGIAGCCAAAGWKLAGD